MLARRILNLFKNIQKEMTCSPAFPHLDLRTVRHPRHRGNQDTEHTPATHQEYYSEPGTLGMRHIHTFCINNFHLKLEFLSDAFEGSPQNASSGGTSGSTREGTHGAESGGRRRHSSFLFGDLVDCFGNVLHGQRLPAGSRRPPLGIR